MAEMTFLESFRFIDTYTEAVLKLREAAHTISRHGADLKEWEAAGEVVKKKIQKEIDVLNQNHRQATIEGERRKGALLKQESQIKEQIEPTLAKARDARMLLDQVIKELDQAKGARDFTIRAAKEEVERILKEARAEAAAVEDEATDRVKIADKRLLEVDASIKQLKQEGINSL